MLKKLLSFALALILLCTGCICGYAQAPDAIPEAGAAAPAAEPEAVDEPAAAVQEEEPVVEESTANAIPDEPTAEPAPEPTVEPVPEEPTAEPTPEPTATPAPAVRSLADDLSFSRGYVYTLREVRAYDHPTKNDYALTIAKGAAVYVVSRPSAGASKDRVEIRFNKDGKSTAAYVDVNKVMYYQGDGLASMLKNAAIDQRAIFLGKNETNPLLPVSYQLYVAPTPEPTATPLPTPEPLPTTEPDDGVTETLVELPAPEETAPAPTGKPDIQRIYFESLVNESLWSTLSESTVFAYRNESYTNGDALPESQHDYENASDKLYHLVYSTNATQLKITFSAETEFEHNWDALLVYDSDGEYVSSHTGTELAGQTLLIPGNGVYLRLVSDGSVTEYGFRVTHVVGVDMNAPFKINRIYGDSAGHLTLEWTNPTGAENYIIQRALVNADTGAVGTYATIAHKKNDYSLSYTDTNTVNGNLYAYRLRLYTTVGGENIYTSFANARYYSFSQPVITGEGAMGGTVGLRHMLRWTAVPGVSRYQVLRSVSETGSYGIIAETTDTSYIAVVGGFRPFWFKIRAFVEVGGREYGGGTAAASPFVRFAYPDTVQNVTTSGATNGSVTITWDKVSNDCPINGYVIYRCPTTTGDFVKVGLVSPSVTRFVDNTVTMGQVYYYRVRAYRKTDTGNAYSNISTPSNAAQVGYPEVPAQLDAACEGNNIRLTWKASANAQGYAVFRSTDPDGVYTRIGASSSNTYLDKSGLAYGTVYYYKVRAYRAYNGTNLYSNYSEAASQAALEKPTLTSRKVEDCRYQLSWTGGRGSDFIMLFMSYDRVNWESVDTYSNIPGSANVNVDNLECDVYFYAVGILEGTDEVYSSTSSTVLHIPLASATPVVYRALLVGNTYPGTESELFAPANDRVAVENMLRTMTGTPYTIYNYANLTADQILSNLNTLAAKADGNDVTLFYYAGHGAYKGILCGTNNTFIWPQQLRALLDQHHGKKVLLISACYSGGIIGKDEVSQRELMDFNQSFISAFTAASKDDSTLASDGYYVLTSSSGEQTSWENGPSLNSGKGWYGVFTQAFLYGSGWNAKGGAMLSKLNADTSGDRMITLSELYTYTLQRTASLGYGSRMHTQVYPVNSSQILFGR